MATETKPLGPQAQKVLDLAKEGKEPKEIQQVLGVSKAAVYGHFKTLRDRGFIEGTTRRRRRSTPQRSPQRSNSSAVTGNPDIDRQVQALVKGIDARLAELDTERASLMRKRDALTS